MIDKTFHHSDPEKIVCETCEHCIYDMKNGLYCTEHKEPIKAYWTCEKANSIRKYYQTKNNNNRNRQPRN